MDFALDDDGHGSDFDIIAEILNNKPISHLPIFPSEYSIFSSDDDTLGKQPDF